VALRVLYRTRARAASATLVSERELEKAPRSEDRLPGIAGDRRPNRGRRKGSRIQARCNRQTYQGALRRRTSGRDGGARFLEGVHINHSVKGCVVRGISDLLSGKANADRARSQRLAADAASAVAFEILSGLGEILPVKITANLQSFGLNKIIPPRSFLRLL
jgi:hypothetical protein